MELMIVTSMDRLKVILMYIFMILFCSQVLDLDDRIRHCYKSWLAGDAKTYGTVDAAWSCIKIAAVCSIVISAKQSHDPILCVSALNQTQQSSLIG